MKEKLTEGAYGLIFKGVDLNTPIIKPGQKGLSAEEEKLLLNSNGEVIYQPVIFKFT